MKILLEKFLIKCGLKKTQEQKDKEDEIFRCCCEGIDYTTKKYIGTDYLEKDYITRLRDKGLLDKPVPRGYLFNRLLDVIEFKESVILAYRDALEAEKLKNNRINGETE